MALVVEQKTRVRRFYVNLGLDVRGSVQQLHTKKGKHSVFLCFHGEIYPWMAIIKDLKKRIVADVRSGMMVKVSSTYLL